MSLGIAVSCVSGGPAANQSEPALSTALELRFKDMAGTFHIFWGRVDRAAVRVETIEGFGNAYELMTKIAAQDPGPYFIVGEDTHIVRGSINTSSSKPPNLSSRYCVRAKNIAPLL
jgi:hypothetical protein